MVIGEIQVHLDEHKVTDIKAAAMLADHYVQTNKKATLLRSEWW